MSSASAAINAEYAVRMIEDMHGHMAKRFNDLADANNRRADELADIKAQLNRIENMLLAMNENQNKPRTFQR